MTVLVGGVAQLYQGDLDVGRLAIDRLLAEGAGAGVIVEELSYGAIAVAQRLEELAPDALVLVGAADRGRPPGSVERRELVDHRPSPEDVQAAVADAATGYVGIDLLVDVAAGFGSLPARTIVIEIEPATTDAAVTLSPQAQGALEEALSLVRAEVAVASREVVE